MEQIVGDGPVGETVKTSSLLRKVVFTFCLIFYGLTTLIIMFTLFFHGFLKELVALYIVRFQTSDLMFILVLSGLLAIYLIILVGLFLLFNGKFYAGLMMYVSGSIAGFVIQLMAISAEGYQKIYIELVVSFMIILYFWLSFVKRNRQKSIESKT